MKTVRVLKTRINCLKSTELVDELLNFYCGENQIKISKINTEFLVRTQKVIEFEETIDRFDIKIADGIGVLWAAKFLSIPTVKIMTLRVFHVLWQWIYTSLSLVFYPKYVRDPIPERIPGVDCLYLMLETALCTDISVYLFGAEKEVLVAAKENLVDKFSKLRIVGSHDGYNYTDKEVIDDINRLGASLLIVALGSPKQEYWIRDNIKKLPSVRVAVGEGGSFDFIAGAFKRAPQWLQRLGLEWLWRLFMNKSKTQTGSRFKRIWQAVPVFMWTVVKYKIKYGANKSEEQ